MIATHGTRRSWASRPSLPFGSYTDRFQIDRVDRLMLNKAVLDQTKGGVDPHTIAAG